MTARRDDVRKAIEEIIKSEKIIYRDLVNRICSLYGCKVDLCKRAIKDMREAGFVSKSGSFYEWNSTPANIDDFKMKVITKNANECKIKVNGKYWTSLLQLQGQTT